ncbi:hypothetical protein PG985_016220 [Apiospora marii]|uniref:uncharacterized protein n=1 Tax=Apiospora marii TaxID=335849 RepID=UPI0031317C9E
MSSSSLFDLLLGLPMELFDLVIEELPVVDQVAFSITCHAAHRLVLHGDHLRDVDWISFRRWRLRPEGRDVNARACREFLECRLAKDLVDRFVYCRHCVQLHRFWDSATETSNGVIARVLDVNPSNYRQDCIMQRVDEPVSLFEGMGQFSITQRQCALMKHYARYGYGINPQEFCRDIEIPVRVTPWLYQAMLSPQSAPRWRRRIEFVPRVDKKYMVLLVKHELVVQGAGTASAKRAARKYLDATPYWICPHLRTHAIGNASDHGEGYYPPGFSWNRRAPGTHWRHMERYPDPREKAIPLPASSICRVPGLHLVKAAAEWDCADRPEDPVFDPIMNGREWLTCQRCAVTWDMDSMWVPRPDKNSRNGFVGGGDEEGTVCLSFTRCSELWLD